MDPDDAAYRRSVRNMSLILAAIVLTVFVSLFAFTYFAPPPAGFQPQASTTSPYGFDLSLSLNATSMGPDGGLSIKGWANNTTPNALNVTAMSSWRVDQHLLWTRICTNGWPIGVGVMQGHYTLDNYTRGTFLQFVQPLATCAVQVGSPPWIDFAPHPHSSLAIVTISGTPTFWLLQSTLDFGHASLGEAQLKPGVYTVVVADEWGDIVMTNFRVS
jgi:hypothetical protein